MPTNIGPVILDLEGTELRAEERDMLQHPMVGGVIFFTRNFQSAAQIERLCQDIRAARTTPILLTVDQEGGRVQRFRQDFTRLPSMGKIGKLFESSSDTALKLAETCGWLMAAELLAVGIDLSLAPVLDLNKIENPAIGDRAFHQDPEIVVSLACAIQKGMRAAGMAAVGKHFPGHGSVSIDTHLDLPVDLRSFDEIAASDLIPFVKLIQNGISGIMPAHIIFSSVDTKQVGFSSIWLKTILRDKLKFSGLIFSDDLNMKGADVGVRYSDRALAALHAGCDMILICNNRPAAVEILATLSNEKFSVSSTKFHALQGQFSFSSLRELIDTTEWQAKNQLLMNYTTQETI